MRNWKVQLPNPDVVFLLHSIYTTNVGRKTREEDGQVANQVEAIRTETGISRQELADQVGVHYQTIGYIERGEYSPSLVLALRIADALGVEVEELFWLEEE
jgi:DNA-binding XRE family transcriptional regulator